MTPLGLPTRSVARACLFALAVAAPTAVSGAASAAAPAVDFQRDVLPILSDACFRCHGPDEATREADLRLDSREGLYRTRRGRSVVAPGAPESSELIRRLRTTDHDDVMPPPEAVRQLSAREKSVLERWVAAGAPWSGHWAFSPLSRHTAPAAEASAAIDAWIHDRLRREQLVPAPEADRERLLRRVTFDLTGLPPTPAEQHAFLADRSPDAYARVVDRLLASPSFGERLATEWLDIARFADTHGYQMDRPRAMWAWRDWVIAAFNEDLPFDQFTTWQLAGDLLPTPTKAQRLATAFNRLHNQNEEGGIVEEEYRVAYVADRVATFGTAFLGLTLDCARCHDHKYDPISQRDYYSLFAFFQNIDEAGQISYAGFADAMPVPTLLLTTEEEDRRLAAFQAHAAERERALADATTAADGAFARWLEARPSAPEAPAPAAHYPLDAVADGASPNAIDPTRPAKAVESPAVVATPRGPAVGLDGENGFTFPGAGHFTRTDPFTLSLWLRAPAPHAPRTVVLHRSKAPADAGSRGYEIMLEGGRVAFALHYLWPGASLKVVSRAPIAADAWTHITATYDGSSRASGARLFVDGVPVEAEVVRDGLFKDITYAKSPPDLALGHRFRDSGFKGGQVRDLRVHDTRLTAIEVALLAGRDEALRTWARPAAELSSSERADLREHFLARVDPATRAAAAALRETRAAQSAFVNPLPEAMVMEELPTPKPAHILVRGAYDAPGEPVTAGTPAHLPPFPDHLPRNRLGLARWLTDPEHPLFSRVTVNRFWQMMFGEGLVSTSDNFGVQGSAPSHPELLDWLARDFAAHGWRVKRLLRQIALSETYRRSSRPSAEIAARDPGNVLLARGPARRLTSEMLRDQALAASGLLVGRVGGASVKPWQPPGLWEEIAMGRPKYETGTGDDLYRRSLYTFWKRTVPPPTPMLFDAADRNVCTVKRQSTSTPLQALALLNDDTFVEAARRTGERLLREGGPTPDEWIPFGFRLVTSRRPSDREVAVLRALYESERARFAGDPEAAARFATVGASPADGALPPAERAAAGVVALALLNFDEAVMRR